MVPRWPPLEGPCEMSVDVEYPKPPSTPGVSWNYPRVIKCHRPGLERKDIRAGFGNPIVCDDCYTAWKEKRG